MECCKYLNNHVCPFKIGTFLIIKTNTSYSMFLSAFQQYEITSFYLWHPISIQTQLHLHCTLRDNVQSFRHIDI